MHIYIYIYILCTNYFYLDHIITDCEAKKPTYNGFRLKVGRFLVKPGENDAGFLRAELVGKSSENQLGTCQDQHHLWISRDCCSDGQYTGNWPWL